MAIDMKAANYQSGVATLRTMVNQLKLKNPTYNMDLLVKFLHVNQEDKKNPISEDDYHSFVEHLGAYRSDFIKGGKSGSNWDKLWTDLIDRTPKGLIPTWAAISKITGNPENYKTTVFEKISNVASGTGKVAVQGKKAITTTVSNVGGAFDFIGKTKYLLLLGGLGYIAYRLLGQSDKISRAYNTVKGDAGALYNKAKSEAVKGIAFVKTNKKQ
jgi:hypothetical protein